MYESTLQKYFNYSTFRPGQEEIVKSIMSGTDVLALMPTGGGKSLCYQLPSLAGNLFTLVISPLIALMKDQVDSLRARGIRAEFINSSLALEDYKYVAEAVRTGSTNILYVAPERLQNPGFLRLIAEREVNFLAIDEAHCVSQWGHDFRPDYLLIKDFIRQFKKRPTVGAFTATATKEVRQEIVDRLQLKNPYICTRGFDRPNLKFFVRSGMKKKDRAKEALRILQKIKGTGIVYTITRKAAEEAAQLFRAQGVAAAPYHAGMDSGLRSRVQNDFMQNKLKVIVATIAFGMGVDKSDIRFVIHAGMPSSLEGYYQEAGRAGRDGDTAYCILIPTKSDGALHHHFLRKSKQDMLEMGKSFVDIRLATDNRYERLHQMQAYADAQECRRKMILQYFSDPAAAQYVENKCDGCDVCWNYVWNGGTDNKVKAEVEETEDSGELSNTVLESVKLYTQGYTPERIAHARTMALTTVVGHLLRWYRAGGEFKIEDFVSPAQEEQIMFAIKKVGENSKLRPIKDLLPDAISYEQIRMVLAKIKK